MGFLLKRDMRKYHKIEILNENGGRDWYFDCASCSFQDKSRIYIFNSGELFDFLQLNRIARLKYINHGVVKI